MKIAPLFPLLALTTLLSACSFAEKQVSLTFIQHTFLESSWEVSGGYSFLDDE